MAWTASVASSLGASESGVKLIVGQLSGYPIFLFHRHFLRQSESWIQHLYFLLTGLFMAYWAIGEEAVIHCTICVLVTYLALKFGGGSQATSIGLLIFNMAYLFIGYVTNATREYDITWTMPQCVICLRLIGLAVDVWDGTKPKEELSKDQAQAALPELPSLLEFFSHSFFVGGYFVGPQFSMKKFQTFVLRNQKDLNLASPVSFGFMRFGVGVLYMLGHLIGSLYVPESWVMSEEFAQMDFLRRSFWFWLWVKVILAKYIAAWLFAEGACILSGLAYNGKDEKTGRILWNGTANVKLRRFESCLRFQHLIEAFNINTNGWVLNYVYKRLRFLNNKTYSQLGVLIFLAVWHGYHSGYYVTFFNEFLIMYLENEFVRLLDKVSLVKSLQAHPIGSLVCKGLGFVYVQFLLPHCFIAFALLKRDKYLAVFKATNYFIYMYCVVGLIAINVLKNFLRKEKKKE